MADHGDWLADLVEPPAPPYPPGSRIAVDVGSYRPATTGRVAAAVTGPPGDVVGYLWRPDLFNLPGHPHEGEPTRLVFSREPRVSPTLRPVDAGARRTPGGRWSFGYGAPGSARSIIPTSNSVPSSGSTSVIRTGRGYRSSRTGPSRRCGCAPAR